MYTYTLSPSVTGVVVAGLLTSWTFSISLAGAACLQTIFPSLRFTEINSSFRLPGSNAVTKMRSPQTHGDPWPRGRSVFQSKALPGPNSDGSMALSFPIPRPPGPRNCGHLSSTNSAPSAMKAHTKPASNIFLTDRLLAIRIPECRTILSSRDLQGGFV